MKQLNTVLLITILWMPFHAAAQPYEHAGGVRAGYSSGVTYKGFFLHRMSAVEAGLFYSQHGLHISLIYEWHTEPFRNSRWLFFLGGGIYGGKWERDIASGLTGAGGIEYTMRELPLNFGFDWRPIWNIYEEFTYDLLDFGVTIRYRFRL
jgi:hypothetical protein